MDYGIAIRVFAPLAEARALEVMPVAEAASAL